MRMMNTAVASIYILATKKCDPRTVAILPAIATQHVLYTSAILIGCETPQSCMRYKPAEMLAHLPCGEAADVRRHAELRPPQYCARTFNMRTSRKAATARRIAIPAILRAHLQHADNPQRCEGMQNCDPRNIARAPSTCGQPAKVRRIVELRPPQFLRAHLQHADNPQRCDGLQNCDPRNGARAPSTCGQPATVRRHAELRSPQYETERHAA